MGRCWKASEWKEEQEYEKGKKEEEDANERSMPAHVGCAGEEEPSVRLRIELASPPSQLDWHWRDQAKRISL